MNNSPRTTAQAAVAVSSLLLGLSSHQPTDHTHVRSPRQKMANSLTLCFEIRIILARNNESCTVGHFSRRVRQESSRITATSTCQGCVRPSHALAAFPPFLSGRSSLASPCLCLFERKTFVIPSHFCRKSETKNFRTCADEHTRLEQRLPVQTPHIKRHTFRKQRTCLWPSR